MAILKYRDPLKGWIGIGVPGVTDHQDLTGLTIDTAHPQYLLLSGGSVTGDLYLMVEPTQPGHAATKRYIDARAGAYTQPNDPGNPASAPNGVRGALWIDTDTGSAGSDFVPLAGNCVITGNLGVAGQLTAPSAPSVSNGFRRITVSTRPPVAGEGVDGDIWFTRTS